MYTVEWENQDGTTFLYNYPVDDFEDPMVLNLDKKIEEDDKTRILMENDHGRQFYYDIYTDSVINYQEGKAKNKKIEKLKKRVNTLEKKLDDSVKVDPRNINNVKEKLIYPNLYANNQFNMSNNLNSVTTSAVPQQQAEQAEEALSQAEQMEEVQVEQQLEPQLLAEEEEIQVFDPSKDNNAVEKLSGLGFGTKFLLTLLVIILLCGIGYGGFYLLNRNKSANKLLSNVRNNLRNNLMR